MRKNTIDMKVSKQETELTKEMIEPFYTHNIAVLQVHPESKIPLWKKWQDTTVDMSRKSINFSINSNFWHLYNRLMLNIQSIVVFLLFDIRKEH